jgi:hypothetical protein
MQQSCMRCVQPALAELVCMDPCLELCRVCSAHSTASSSSTAAAAAAVLIISIYVNIICRAVWPMQGVRGLLALSLASARGGVSDVAMITADGACFMLTE